MEKDVLYAILRSDFKSFVRKCFQEVSPNDTYSDNWHIDLICNELENVSSDKNNRLIVNIPPRYMKSIICSVAYPAYILGKNPKASIIAVSYNDELSNKLANDCRKIIESHWYKELFPGTKLSKSKKAISDFETTRGGGRFSTSVNGTLTGRGGDYLIIDDPIKPSDANSDLIRTKTNDWYGSTLYSRLNDKNNGKIVVIMQRLHDEDFTGYLLNTDSSFKHINLPAIAEKDEEWHLKKCTILRKKGEALHPERESLEKLLYAKIQMGEYAFAGQYQQNPAPLDGGFIKKKWFKFYNKAELIKNIKENKIRGGEIIQSWDSASTIKESSDYSVCLTFFVHEAEFYLLDCYRAKLEFPDLLKKIKELHLSAKNKYECSVDIMMEGKASGIQAIQCLEKERVYLNEVQPEHDKQTRLRNVSHLIENGSCMFPDNNPDWWYDFEQELLRFPNAKHDDQCDALSQALSNYKPCGVKILTGIMV